jgi:hypothetical protein
MMNDESADQIVGLLQDILEELRDLRSDFQEFTGYNTTKMSDAVNEITERITGGIAGVGGGDLDDVVRAVRSVESAIDLK